MYTDDFRQQVLIEPIRKGAGRLCIVSGYETPSMQTWHIQTLNEFGIALVLQTVLSFGNQI